MTTTNLAATAEKHSDKHLVLITPDAEFETFHDWLTSEKGMDLVHSISGREELLTKRL